MEHYLNYTPIVALARLAHHDVERFMEQAKLGERLTDDGVDAETSPNVTRAVALVVFLFVLSLVVFALNIVGIVYEFKCKYTVLGVLSIVALFFGLPVGMIFYLVYLINPAICKSE